MRFVNRIKIYYNSLEFKNIIEAFSDYIKNETLAKEIIFKDIADEEINVNGIKVIVTIEKTK